MPPASLWPGVHPTRSRPPMFDRLRTLALRFLRVPPDPAPPAGAPGSLRVFRGGANLYKLRLVAWAFGQVGAVAGIVFSVGMLHRMESAHADAAARAAATPSPAAVAPAPAESGGKKSAASPRKPRPPSLERLVARWPAWIFPLLTLVEAAAIVGFVLQIPFTYALVRLDYELRWYLVTDRSLRIRTGITTVRESTMSFANLQQVVVTQGPIQRLLGLADVRVQSAGGGGDHNAQGKNGAAESLHTGVFHGVANADEIRDLILERLRVFRAAGLGDPDEPAAAPTPVAAPAPAPADAIAAAHELLAEARALRTAVTGHAG